MDSRWQVYGPGAAGAAPRFCQIQCQQGSIASRTLRARLALASSLAIAMRNAAINQGSRFSTKTPTMTNAKTLADEAHEHVEPIHFGVLGDTQRRSSGEA